MARALAAAIVVSLLAVAGAGGAPAQPPKRGGTVVVAWGSAAPVPTCVIPRFTEPPCPYGLNAQLMHLVLAGNLRVRPEGWSPNLVARYSHERDPFAVTFHIRPDARWSDGRPITAADYIFSHRVYSRVFPPERYVWADVRRAQALDAKTVRITWNRPTSSWQFQTGVFPTSPRHILRGHVASDVWAEAIVDPRTAQPIGSGPFLLQRFRRGLELVLVRNPRYWGPHRAYLDRLVIRFGVNSADALRRGDVDVVGGGGRDQAAALELLDEPGVRVHREADSAWEHLDFNLRSGHPALRNKLVRRALAFGIDRAAIVRELFSKTSPTLRVLDSTAFLPTERGYRSNWSGYRYRPEEARRLLRQAGCRRGADGIYECAGRRLSLRFVTTAGVPHRERTLELVHDQLRAVGVRVEPVYAATLGFLDAGDFDVALFTWRKDNPGETGSWPYSCAERDRAGNVTGYCSRLFNADFDQLFRIVDPARYAAVANRADRRLARDVPVLPLYQPLKVYAYRSSLRGVRANPFWSITWNAEDWWLAD